MSKARGKKGKGEEFGELDKEMMENPFMRNWMQESKRTVNRKQSEIVKIRKANNELMMHLKNLNTELDMNLEKAKLKPKQVNVPAEMHLITMRQKNELESLNKLITCSENEIEILSHKSKADTGYERIMDLQKRLNHSSKEGIRLQKAVKQGVRDQIKIEKQLVKKNKEVEENWRRREFEGVSVDEERHMHLIKKEFEKGEKFLEKVEQLEETDEKREKHVDDLKKKIEDEEGKPVLRKSESRAEDKEEIDKEMVNEQKEKLEYFQGESICNQEEYDKEINELKKQRKDLKIKFAELNSKNKVSRHKLSQINNMLKLEKSQAFRQKNAGAKRENRMESAKDKYARLKLSKPKKTGETGVGPEGEEDEEGDDEDEEEEEGEANEEYSEYDNEKGGRKEEESA